MSTGGTKPRNRALCCRCGDLRTVAHNYRRRQPSASTGGDAVGPWCARLLCSHCGEITVHAIVVDALADRWRATGCDREQHDRTTDRCRRRIERRLRALIAEGVTVVRVPSPGELALDDSIVEVIEYADARGFVLRVRTIEEPRKILRALDLAEDLIDAPTQFGPWADDGDGLRRGLAVMADAL